ncbi:IS66 family transposase [Eleftheria terrae]|uniref:IS66 family transposase n=1 Tax=Eleftheria terrae TaxID=1597781 RepID=UPI0034142CE0
MTTASGPGRQLLRYLDDATLPADNSWAENPIRPIAPGRTPWLLPGRLRAGPRAAAIKSWIQSAKISDVESWRGPRDMMEVRTGPRVGKDAAGFISRRIRRREAATPTGLAR